jgi:tetratricopeptide (TPR) repeat protein
MESDAISLVSLREEYGATHVLRGSVHHEPPVVLANIHLIDTATGRIVWAHRNEQFIDEATMRVESRMALQIAASLSAVVNSDEEALINRGLSTNLLSLALYRQGQSVMNPPFDPDRLNSARFIFERLSDIDPAFAGGPAGVGFTYVAAVMARSSRNPVEDLERGFGLARDAIEIDDAFAMGHATLGFAHAMNGERGPALAASAAALARQPGDAMVQFTAGLIHSVLREYRESIPYFEEALRLDPIEPRAPYLNLLGIAYLATGKPERTVALLDRNIERGGPNDVHLGVYRALAYAELGRMDDAQAALDTAHNGPAPIEPATMLGGLFGPGAELDQALDLLTELGYTPPVQTSRVDKRSQP